MEYLSKALQGDDIHWYSYNASSDTFDGIAGAVERGVLRVYALVNLRRTVNQHESILATAYARFSIVAQRAGMTAS